MSRAFSLYYVLTRLSLEKRRRKRRKFEYRLAAVYLIGVSTEKKNGQIGLTKTGKDGGKKTGENRAADNLN